MFGRFGCSLALVVSLAGSARAQPSESTESAKPGECHYLTDRVKECYPVNYIGTFTIKTYPGVTTSVHLPEDVNSPVLWPSEEVFENPSKPTRGQPSKPTRVLTLFCVAKVVPPSVTMLVRTEHYSLTLAFEVVASAKEADLQLHVVPYDQRGKDLQCERRIAAERDVLAAQFAPRLKRAVKKEVMRGLATMESGKLRGKPARSNHIILTPRRWTRLGDLYVEVEVGNQRRLMHIDDVVLEVGKGKARTELKTSRWRCDRTRLTTYQEARCWVQVPRALAANERLYITVAARGGRRKVTSGALDVR